ncbi:methyltransferase [Asinibacterium sp. OR53]|uniref:methyltransferase n=1 Tax=Asinibacterium sp. OR53 TaxID=925409 RepID=UPI00047B3725|nr:methyltransferase [Asinibacterium sp. OR53]
MNNQLPPPPAQMMQLITGFWTSCCVYSAAKLNIADHLKDKPQTAHQLAEATHSDAPSLYRVLRALSSVGVFKENEDHQFELTSLGNTLQTDAPGSMKAMAIAQLGDHYNAWGNLVYSIKTGHIAFDNIEGMSVWKYYEMHPEEGVNFIKAMSGLTGAVIQHVLPEYDFTSFNTIVDVGGGNGALLVAVLDKAPQAKGIVFDEEYVVAETKKLIAKKGFSSRCETAAGSFFEFIPENADAYLMKMVLHDWNDEQCLQILNNCNKAMKAGSKLLVLDSVIPEGNEPHPGKFMDINMLAMTGGRERTEKEFASLFSNAGLKLARVIPTHSPMFSIVEAIKE